MKIALSTSVIQRGRSGVGQYVLSLVRALLPAARQHDFTLFVLEEDRPLFDFAAGAMRLEPVAERHRPPVKNILWHQLELPRLARQRGIDVLHVPSYRRMPWARPCALVATIHDLAPFHLAGKYDPARMLYGRCLARRLAQRQHRIIAVSGTTAADLAAFYRIPAGRVSIVPNGIDHDRFQPGSRARARAAVCRPRGIDGPFFLYVARLEHPAKNHQRLIEAFQNFKAAGASPWRLVLAGSDWHGAETIHELIRRSPFAADIHRLGFVAPSELPDWYRAADVLVFPSLYEGFGLPPVEAMACGCAVLSSTRGALGETTGGAAAFLDPDDSAQIEGQLARAAGDPAWRRELSAAGLVQARKFDWKATAEATLEVYDQARADRLRSRGSGSAAAVCASDVGERGARLRSLDASSEAAVSTPRPQEEAARLRLLNASSDAAVSTLRPQGGDWGSHRRVNWVPTYLPEAPFHVSCKRAKERAGSAPANDD